MTKAMYGEVETDTTELRNAISNYVLSVHGVINDCFDTSRVNTFTNLEQLPYLSKRFLLKRYLGLTEEEIVENEKMWREERDQPELQQATGADLRAVGVSPGALEADMQTGEQLTNLQPAGPGGEPPAAPAVAAPGPAAASAGAPPGAPPLPQL